MYQFGLKSCFVAQKILVEILRWRDTSSLYLNIPTGTDCHIICDILGNKKKKKNHTRPSDKKQKVKHAAGSSPYKRRTKDGVMTEKSWFRRVTICNHQAAALIDSRCIFRCSFLKHRDVNSLARHYFLSTPPPPSQTHDRHVLHLREHLVHFINRM